MQHLLQRKILELKRPFAFCFVLKAIDIRGGLSTAPRTQLSGEVSYIFVGCILRAPTLTNWRGWNQHFCDILGVFSKEEARIKKRKMTWPSSLVGGHNRTPGLGLCQFNSEKNGVKAFRAFMVNSYIELSRWDIMYIMWLADDRYIPALDPCIESIQTHETSKFITLALNSYTLPKVLC